jgi:hypothetical protein
MSIVSLSTTRGNTHFFRLAASPFQRSAEPGFGPESAYCQKLVTLHPEASEYMIISDLKKIQTYCHPAGRDPRWEAQSAIHNGLSFPNAALLPVQAFHQAVVV